MTVRSLLAPALITLVAAGCASAPREEPPRPRALFDSGGPLSPAQAAYSVARYDIDTEVFPATKAIAGSATVHFVAEAAMSALVLNFDGKYDISQVTVDGVPAGWSETPTLLTIALPEPLAPGERSAATITYSGHPHIAERPPWRGGFTFETAPSGQPWIATSFQGEGCDLWWPCKDHPLGEPSEGVTLSITVPEGLTAVANGTLRRTETRAGKSTFHWETDYSTNLYGIALNVGPYVLIEDTATSTNGRPVPMKFWALQSREEQARDLFEGEFETMLAFFEGYLGPFPWAREKLGVVETPHLGMEHQTVNAYGNQYREGEYGFDWLLHHELAHEWFGNLMSVRNNADMWLHEGTASYMDSLRAGAAMGDEGLRSHLNTSYQRIEACAPLAPEGERTVDQVYTTEYGGPGGDIYSKGAWVLHSLRYTMGDQAFWHAIRTLLYGVPDPLTLEPPYEPRFRTTDDFLAIVSSEAGRDMGWFFETYVRQGPLPELAQRTDGNDLILEWQGTAGAFPMPVPVQIDGRTVRVEMPAAGPARLSGAAGRDVVIDPNAAILRKTDALPTCAERRAAEAAEADEG